MSLYKTLSSNGSVVCMVLLVVLCFGLGCRNKDNVVVLRILVPPSSSPLKEAIAKLQRFPVATDTGRKVVLATMETKDDGQYRMFLQNVQTYRPQVVVVPTRNDIPASFQGVNSYATRPCSPLPTPCIALIAPWASTEERRAAELVLRRTGPGGHATGEAGDPNRNTGTPDESGGAAQH